MSLICVDAAGVARLSHKVTPDKLRKANPAQAGTAISLITRLQFFLNVLDRMQSKSVSDPPDHIACLFPSDVACGLYRAWAHGLLRAGLYSVRMLPNKELRMASGWSRPIPPSPKVLTRCLQRCRKAWPFMASVLVAPPIEDETSCGVCLEEYNKKTPFVTKCMHCMCYSCASQLAAKHIRTCPFCRAADWNLL